MNAGTYKARALTWGLGLTSTTKEQVGVQFTVTDGEFKGHRIGWYGYFTDAAYERTLESMRACGWTGTDLSDGLPGMDANEVEIVVEMDSYTNKEGQTKSGLKVKWINALSGPLLKEQLTQDQATAFAARMKGKIALFDKNSGKPKSAAKQNTGADPRPNPPPVGLGDNEDIPF